MGVYVVRAVRRAQGWELRVDGVGVTHCRTIESAEQHVRLMVEMLTGVDATEDTVSIRVDLGEESRPLPVASGEPPFRRE